RVVLAGRARYRVDVRVVVNDEVRRCDLVVGRRTREGHRGRRQGEDGCCHGGAQRQDEGTGKGHPPADRLQAALTLGEVQVQERNAEASGEEKPEEAEEEPAEAKVPAVELGVHQSARSRASAAKSSAR